MMTYKEEISYIHDVSIISKWLDHQDLVFWRYTIKSVTAWGGKPAQ